MWSQPWEFIEHIEEADLPGVFANIRRHLKDGGLLIGSTNDAELIFQGVEHHRTRKPPQWWGELFEAQGFTWCPFFEKQIGSDWVRRTQFNFVFEKVQR